MTPVRNVVFVFLDGVGLGTSDPALNPFARLSLPAFERLAGGQPWTEAARAITEDRHVFRSVDANLNMPGLPQSGTGQVALFTGINGARLAGRHFGPYPHSKTKPVIASDSVFRKVQALDDEFEVAFANAYPDRFFSFVHRTNRWTVTTLCCLEADVPLRGYTEWQQGRALTADLTGAPWHRIGYDDLIPISEAEAGRRLIRLADDHAFTLFEYYLTDKAGHSQSHDRAAECLLALDRFFEGILEHLDPECHLLIVCSDHGNLEDLSSKTHTRNPVPLAAYGSGARRFAEINSILDVTPAIVQALTPSA